MFKRNALETSHFAFAVLVFVNNMHINLSCYDYNIETSESFVNEKDWEIIPSLTGG